MRNDVKLGLAIGGVLLAVLIVYVLVVPAGGKKPSQASNPQQQSGGGAVTIEPAPDAQVAIPAAPPEAPGATFTPPSSSTPSAPANETPPAAPEQTASAANGKEIDWAKLLDGQQTLIAETPVPAPRSEAGNVAIGAADGAGATAATPTAPTEPAIAPAPAPSAESTAAVLEPKGDVPAPAEAAPTAIASATPRAAEPTVQPTSPSSDVLGPTKERTHVVREGETLSSISAAAYGSPNHYPAIIRANPGLDPNRMKVGQTINLPAINLAAASDAQSASARIAPTIDATKQYRVQPGDSLHKISLRLYGKSDRANKLYELNKKAIGDDPARVKAGQILELPEPPTQTASR